MKICRKVLVVVYIFRHFNHYMFTEFNKNNNEEEKSSGTTGAGVSQKDLHIKNNKEEERSGGTTGTGVSQKDLQIKTSVLNK